VRQENWKLVLTSFPVKIEHPEKDNLIQPALHYAIYPQLAQG
jgi:hypothetical protein